MLSQKFNWPLLALVIAAVLVRVIYYTQLSGSGGPLLQLHRWDQSDMHFYDAWAKVIASGDVLINRPLHPVHDWHVAVGQAYLGENATREQIEAAWNDWYGGKRFHQEPLYAYLIGLTYAVLGEDVRWVFAWQMAMGMVSTVLVYRIGRRHFGEAAGLTAAGLTVLAGPLMVYELVLLRGPLITFLGLLAVDAAGVAWERNNWRWWMAAGAACGAAMLAHGGAQVLVPVVVVTAVIRGGIAKPPFDKLRVWRQAWLGAGVVVLGVGVVLLPAMVRNVVAGVGPLQLSSVGAVTFIATNGPGQHADMSFYATTAIPEVLNAARTGGAGVVARTIAMHENVGSYVGLIVRKISMAWRWFEKPNNVSFAYFAKHAWVLNVLPVRFAVVAPLGLVGLAMIVMRLRRQWVQLLPLLALVGVGTLSCVVAAPHARYRAPMVAWLAPLAGLAVVQIVRSARGDTKPQALLPGAAAIAAVVVLFLLTLRPLPYGVTAITHADWLSPYRVFWLPRQEAAASSGDWATATKVLEESFDYRPMVIDDLSRERPAATAEEADLARFYAAIYARYGEALRESSQTQKALAAERRSMDLLEAAAMWDVAKPKESPPRP